MPMAMTWPLELHGGFTADGVAGLFCGGPSMLVSLSLSSGTSSQCPQSRLFQSSAWREMVWFLVSEVSEEDWVWGKVSACTVPTHP